MMVEFASIVTNLLAGVPRYHHVARDMSLQTRQTLNCVSTASGRFGLFPNSVSSASSVGGTANCTGDNLVVQLNNGVLTDSLNQTAGTITGPRFVFGDPSSLSDTNDWHMCTDGSLTLLALNSTTDFWECSSGFLYLEQINSTCSEENLVLAPCSTTSSTGTTSTTISSSSTSSSSSALSFPTTQLTSESNPATSPTLATTTSASPTSIATSSSSSTDSGIPYSTKLGLGIGLGIGIPLLLFALFIWCLGSRGTILGRKRPAPKFEPGIAVDEEPGVAVSETKDAGTFIR